MNTPKTVITTYRRLENFLYNMGINPVRTFKSWDGCTAWEYEQTAELRIAVDTFRELDAKLKAQREGAEHD